MSERGTPPEIELVLRCLRAHLGTESLAGLASFIREHPGLDRERVRTFATGHRVVPVVHRTLSALDDESVPGRLIDGLRARRDVNAKRNLYLAHLLHRLLDRFDDDGIRAIPFKGPVLAETSYGDLSLREFSDLDVLVPRDRITRATDVLFEQGYSRTDDLRAISDAEALDDDSPMIHSPEWIFHRETDGSIVELRWHLGERSRPFRVGFDAVWADRDRIRVAGTPVPSLPASLRLPYLVYHGSKHSWTRLSWLLDLAEASRSNRMQADGRLSRSLRRFSLGRKSRVAGSLLSHLLGVTSFPPTVEGAEDDRIATLLASAIQERLTAGTARLAPLTGGTAFNTLSADSVRDAMNVLRHSVATPTVAEYRLLPISRTYRPLYYLLRPFRLFYERVIERWPNDHEADG